MTAAARGLGKDPAEKVAATRRTDADRPARKLFVRRQEFFVKT